MNRPDLETPELAKTYNMMGFAGFVLGCASILLAFIGIIPILAIVFSAIGWRTFDPKKHKAGWQARVGLVLGILYFFVYLQRYGYLGI